MKFSSRSPEDTVRFGEVLGGFAASGDLFLLKGDLGSGKTSLTQGIVWGAGIDEYVRSPTFVLVSHYSGKIDVHHMDLYRLEMVGEFLELGLEEYFDGLGCCVIEWADKAARHLPCEHLLVTLEYVGENERLVSVEGHGDRYIRILNGLQEYVDDHGTSH